MILWTIQHETFLNVLRQRGRLRAKWRDVQANWKPAYLWMAQQMVQRGCCSRPVAPIWAWHSCGALGRAPDQEAVEDLVGYIGQKVLSVEIDVPERLVLLSHYGIWNSILDQVILAGRDGAMPDPIGNNWKRVLRVRIKNRKPWGGENYQDIQACIPYVDRGWVRRVEEYTVPLMDDKLKAWTNSDSHLFPAARRQPDR